MQKNQTIFMNYKKRKSVIGEKVMTKEEQLARFWSIYDKMSDTDKQCLVVGMTYILGGRICLIFAIGIAIGITIGAYLW